MTYNGFNTFEEMMDDYLNNLSIRERVINKIMSPIRKYIIWPGSKFKRAIKASWQRAFRGYSDNLLFEGGYEIARQGIIAIDANLASDGLPGIYYAKVQPGIDYANNEAITALDDEVKKVWTNDLQSARLGLVELLSEEGNQNMSTEELTEKLRLFGEILPHLWT